jgi:hypothetical protein
LTRHYADYVKIHYNYFGNVTFYSFLCNLKAQGLLPANFPALQAQFIFSFSLALVAIVVLYRLRKSAMQQNLLWYGGWLSVLPLLSYFGENHHYTFVLIGLAGWLQYPGLFQHRNYSIALVTGWLLVYLGFYFQELGVTFGPSFYVNYLDGFGVLLMVITFLTAGWRYSVSPSGYARKKETE